MFVGDINFQDGTIPKLIFSQQEVGTIISPQMGTRHMNQPSVFNGYVILAGNAEHEVWDISNPYSPAMRAEMISAHKNGEAESHQVTYGKDLNGRYYLATISGRGIDIWDVTNTLSPTYVNAIVVDGVNYGDVDNAIWGLSWQGNFLFVGATNQGLIVFDVSDVNNPTIISRLSLSQLGGVYAGPLFAVGNLLTITTPKEYAGIATVDISNPQNPILLDSRTFSEKSYIGNFYGKNAYLINPFRTFDVTSDPSAIELISSITNPRAEYMSFAEQKLFLGGMRGGTQGIYKYDISNQNQLQLETRIPGRSASFDDQFSVPIGNMLVMADDQFVNNTYVSAVMAVHGTQPDNNGLSVLYYNPDRNLDNVPTTSRIGISFDDWVELTSVDSNSFQVFDDSGNQVSGRWGLNYTTLNFSPAQPLKVGTSYTVFLPQGGITDLSGNGLKADFELSFRTEGTPEPIDEDVELYEIVPTELGNPTVFGIINPKPDMKYEWELGDGSQQVGSEISHVYQEAGRYSVVLNAYKQINSQGVLDVQLANLSGGVALSSSHSGAYQNTYADFPNIQGNNVSVSWSFNESAQRSVKISFRYASVDNSRTLNLYVNGNFIQELNFSSTESWDTWNVITSNEIVLQSGTNTIELTADAGTAGPNLDYMYIEPPNNGDENYVLVDSHAFTQIIFEPAPVLRPQQSSALHLSEGFLWVANQDANTVSVVSTENFQKLNEVSVGQMPISIASDDQDRIWVLNKESWNITLLDKNSGAELEEITLPYASRPTGILISPDRAHAYIVLSAIGQIIKMNTQTFVIEATLNIAGDNDGITPELGSLAMTADGQKIYVLRFISSNSSAKVYAIGTANLNLEKQITLSYSQGDDTSSFSRGLPNYLASISISPDGNLACIPSKKDNVQRGEFRDGNPLTHDLTVRAINSFIDLNTDSELLNRRIDMDNIDRGHTAVFNTLGDLFYISQPGNNQVWVFETSTGNKINEIDTQKVPQDMLFDSDNKQLFVHNFLSRSISVFDMNSNSNEAELLADISLIDQEPLSAEVLLGKQLFYDATSTKLNMEGYMSCVSCHMDGGHDGRVWDFTNMGEGLRNTIDLRGKAGTREGALHWSANFDEVHDFENQIRNFGGGTGLMENADFSTGTVSEPMGDLKKGYSSDLDALAAYVTSLGTHLPSPYKNQDGSMTSEAQAGAVLFNDLKCFQCHGGESYTDSPKGLMHDVGTIGTGSGQRVNKTLLGIDTPGLRGIWATAPYLHDGSATTLRDVIVGQNQSMAHGSVSNLSASEVDQLVSFLIQLDGQTPAAQESNIVAILNIPESNMETTYGIPIELSVSHNLDNVSAVNYYANGDLIASSTQLPFELEWTPDLSGNVSLVAKIFYGDSGKAVITSTKRIFIEEPVRVSSIAISPENIDLSIGESHSFTAIVSPSNAADKEVNWSIQDETIAMVDTDGVVTAISEGFTELSVVTNDGNFEAIASLNIFEPTIAVTGISLDSEEIVLVKGSTAQLTAQVIPEEASNKNVVWISDDESIVVIDSNGLITAIEEGIAMITVSTVDGNYQAVLEVTVIAEEIGITSISLDFNELVLTEGETVSVSITILPENATNQNVFWSSNDENIVMVDSEGSITALQEGTTEIIVTTEQGGYQDIANVTVQPAEIAVTGINVNDKEIELLEGESTVLDATVIPENASDKNISWSSQDDAVAIVDSSGLVVAVSEGTALITATTINGGFSDTSLVTVRKPVVAVSGIGLNLEAADIFVGETLTLTATIEPSNASNQTLFWSSNNPEVAQVDLSGLVMANSEGEAIITVMTEDGGYEASLQLNVLNNIQQSIAVQAIALNPSLISIATGQKSQFSPSFIPYNATNQNVLWSSKNPLIANVDSEGLVTGISPGLTKIRVTTIDGNFYAEASVQVTLYEGTKDVLPSLMISPNPASDWLYVVMKKEGEAKLIVRSIDVFQLNGKKAKEFRIGHYDLSRQNLRFDISQLKSGNYIVVIHTVNQGVYLRRLIIN